MVTGDGIGPEITSATKVELKILCDRFRLSLELKDALIGGAVIDSVNYPFPKKTLD